jgi:hypothetical protein
MLNEKAYLIRIKSDTGRIWYLHNVSGELFEVRNRSAAKAAVTKLKRKQSAGGPRCTFEIEVVHY